MQINRAKALTLLNTLRSLQSNGIRASARFGYGVQRNIARLEEIEKAVQVAMKGDWDDVLAKSEPARLAILADHKNDDGQIDVNAANNAWVEYVQANPELQDALQHRHQRGVDLDNGVEEIDFYLIDISEFPDDLDMRLMGELSPLVRE